jgi:hypothetical protein
VALARRGPRARSPGPLSRSPRPRRRRAVQPAPNARTSTPMMRPWPQIRAFASAPEAAPGDTA